MLLLALQEKLTPESNGDFDSNKEQIKKLIAAEIAKRYYFQKGELIQSLKEDEALEKALDVLADPTLYQQTLSAPTESTEKAAQ